MTFQKGHLPLGHRQKGTQTHNKPYATVKKWAKPWLEHGRAEDPHQINPQTKCKCGKEFTDERGLLVHIGRSSKLSAMVVAGKPE